MNQSNQLFTNNKPTMPDETRLTIPVNDRTHKGLKQIALNEKRSMTAQAALVLEEFVNQYNFTRQTK